MHCIKATLFTLLLLGVFSTIVTAQVTTRKWPNNEFPRLTFVLVNVVLEGDSKRLDLDAGAMAHEIETGFQRMGVRVNGLVEGHVWSASSLAEDMVRSGYVELVIDSVDNNDWILSYVRLRLREEVMPFRDPKAPMWAVSWERGQLISTPRASFGQALYEARKNLAVMFAYDYLKASGEIPANTRPKRTDRAYRKR